MNNEGRQEILLESGTNEMEIIEFYLGSQSFGINVQKLREIICFDPSKNTVLPQSAPSVVGSFMVRGNTIPLIDLSIHLNRQTPDSPCEEVRQVVLVCEFNNAVTGFLVDGVNQIHRVSWQDVSPLANYIGQFNPRFTGSVHVNEREVLIVDVEHIVAEIDPSLKIVETLCAENEQSPQEEDVSPEKRQQVRLMLAEDSILIRKSIVRVLRSAGYSNLKTFVDGEDCLKEISALKNQGGQVPLDLLITDIEMPKMDGLTLCRTLRERLGMAELPVVMFSSLINEQMALKCKSVGATNCISKPQIPELVGVIDQICLEGKTPIFYKESS